MDRPGMSKCCVIDLIKATSSSDTGIDVFVFEASEAFLCSLFTER